MDQQSALHVAWPKREDGSNKSLGEMTPEERRAQLKAAVERFKVKHAQAATAPSEH